MTTEQEGAPSATAGGASAPDPWDIGHSPATGGRNLYVRDADGDVYVGVIFEPADARRIVEAMNAAERPRLAAPRDAEIEQLRTALARYQKRLGDDLVCGGKLVERVRAALRVDNGGTCTRASMNGVVGEVGRLCAEIERLRADVLVVQQHLQRAHGQPDSCVTTEYMGPDFSRAMVDGLRDGKEKAEASLAVEQRNLLNEMDEHQTAQALLADAREEWKHADAEVTRLRGQVDELAGIRVALFGEVRQALSERDEARAELAKVATERNRLRQELDLIHEQHAAGLVTLRTDFTAAVNGLLPKPAEPRRWIAGDPEPEIGTTVWRRAERYRRSSNGWHRVGDFTGYGSWAWILSVGSEVVEAVDRG